MSSLKEKYHKFLHFGTEFMGLDLKYFASGGFWTTLGQGINGILAFLLTIAFANLLPKETYGLYRYILSLAGIFSIFTLIGMNDAIVQATAAGNEGALRTSFKYQVKWNLMMMLALWATAGYYFWQNNFIFGVSLFVLGTFSPLTQALNTYGAYLHGKKEFKINNIFGILATIVYATGMFIMLLLTKEVVPLIATYTITTFATNLFFYYKTVKLFNLPATTSKDALKYGRHLTFIGLMSPIVTQIDSIVLAHFWGPAQLAVYSLARVIPDRVTPFVKDIIDLGLPRLVQKTSDDINKVFYKRIFQTMVLGAILTASYIVTAPFVFKYILPKYLESVFYSQILALNFIFIMPSGYVGTVFGSKKLFTRPLFVTCGFIMSGFKILLYIIFGIFGGILGLILAQITYQISSVSVSAIMWKHEIKRLQKNPD